jgi:nifR3 family TIM-barrel protein
MAGVADAAFRLLCREFGARLSFTEVVTARGLVHGSRRTAFLLETFDGERPAAAHFYGREPEVLAEAARHAEACGRFDAIDLNCGCPVRRITNKGCGAALMAEPALIERIVRAICGAVALPVTVKTRLGLTQAHRTIADVAAAVEQGGAAALIVHARYACNHHSGPADWEELARIKARCGIPVIGNGGADSGPDARAMMERTGVDGVMIGRAAWGAPWVFREAEAALRGEPVPPPPEPEERRRIAERHFDLVLALKRRQAELKLGNWRAPESAASLLFRAHLLRYAAGLKRAGRIRRELNTMNSAAAIRDALARVFAPPR